MKTSKRKAVFFLIIIFTAPLFSLENVKVLLKSTNNLISPLPENQLMDIKEIRVKDGKEKIRFYRFFYSVNKEANTLSIVASDGTFRGSWDSQFKIISKKRIIKDEEVIKRWHVDEKKYTLDPETGKVVVEEFREGKKVNTKNMENKLLEMDIDALTPFLQVMTAKQIGSFNADTSMDGFIVNLDFNLIKTREPLKLTADLPQPESVAKLRSLKEDIYVWSFGATGLMALVHPARFFIAFQGKAPFAFIASWGGQKDEAYYSICQANLP